MTEARETEQHAERGNRQQRRARRSRVARFARGRTVLQTALLDTADIARHPRAELLRVAATQWRASGSSATCFVCQEDAQHARAFLFAWVGSTPTQTAASGLCFRCWDDDDADAINSAATRTLRQILRDGHFLDPRAQP